MSETYIARDLMAAFGVTKEALFYYEKIGLLQPDRDPANNYRRYTERDVLTMLEIQNMTGLGFSLAEIRDYTKKHDVASTRQILIAEIEKLDTSLKKLKILKRSLTEKRQRLEDIENMPVSAPCRLIFEKGRRCLLLSDHDLSLTETLVEIGKLETRYGHTFSFLGCSDCYEFPLGEPFGDPAANIQRIFLYSADENFPSDFTLPEGTYVQMFYRGDYTKSLPAVQRVRNYIKRKHLSVLSNCYSFFHISELETDDPEENIIEFLVQVEDL